MGAQVRAVREGSAAVGAGEGLLTSVGADVALQQPGPGEGLSAGRANAGQRVASDVHLQRAQAQVLLVAYLQLKAFLDWGSLATESLASCLGS